MYGKVWTGAYGPTQPMILSIHGEEFGGGILADIRVRPQYTERSFAIFYNATFLETKWADTDGIMRGIMIPALPEAINSFFIEDIGRLTEITPEALEYVAERAKANDALTANKILHEWDNFGKYSQTAVNGDNHLTSIVVTGARRGLNCTARTNIPTRARLTYTIKSDISNNLWVRWYDITRLVAEGNRVGNGAVVCDEVDESGLSVTCTITGI